MHRGWQAKAGRPGTVHEEIVGSAWSEFVDRGTEPTGASPLPVGEPQSVNHGGEGSRCPLGKDRKAYLEGWLVEGVDDAGH